MKKITENEEKEMYDIIYEALLALCQEKPNNPVDYLSRKLLELVGDDSEFYRKPKLSFSKTSNDEVNVNVDKFSLNNLTKKFNEHYKVLTLLGVGSHGEVYSVQDLEFEGVKKVVKIVPKHSEDPHFLTEKAIEMLLSLDHPNIVKSYDILEDESHWYFVTDLCEGGDLFTFIVENKNLSERFIKGIVRQILDALNYLHQRGIVHRDIKPENILISKKTVSDNKDITVKLTDFGSSQFLGKKKRGGGKIVASPFYTAPEVIEGKFDAKCDLWSVGVITYTLLCGSPPFAGKHYEIFNRILTEDVKFVDSHSELARDFITGLMRKAPKLRPEVKAALAHPWLEEEDSGSSTVGIEILNNMTKFVLGKNLRRSVVSYILSRKMYAENNDNLRKVFKEIDTDGNGHIDSKELFLAYGKHFPGTLEEVWNQINILIDRIDINNNGKLEYSEFLAVVSIMNKELNQKMLKSVFSFYDTDGNGFIQASDLREIFEGSDVDSSVFQNMIDEYDQDGDRKISFSEFYDMIINNI